jgi:phosphatidylethanolamine/phosphatidyl-N-methylethanolamine N-methyltransferase
MDKNPIEDYYKKDYTNIHYQGLLGGFTGLYHRLIELTSDNRLGGEILEIGAGEGEHLKYVNPNFSKYILSDISVRKNLDLDRKIASYAALGIEVLQIEADAANLPFGDATFDRIISTCVLLHMNDPQAALREMRRVAKPGGLVSIYLPCDPGAVYRWVRHFGSHLKQARKSKSTLSTVKYLWALEHRNHFLSISLMIKECFGRDNVKTFRYPIQWLSWNFNFFVILQIRIPVS